MFEILENHSGKIFIVLAGATLLGGAGVVGYASYWGIMALYGTEIAMLTSAAGAGAVASGLSFLRREEARRNEAERVQGGIEDNRRSRTNSNQVNAARISGQSNQSIINRFHNTEYHAEYRGLKRENDTLRADLNATMLRLDAVEGKYASLSEGLARKEKHDEKAAYIAGIESDTDSNFSKDEATQPLLSDNNMFKKQPSISTLNAAANEGTIGVVHRRRKNMG